MVIGWFDAVVVVQKCGFWWMEVLFGRWKISDDSLCDEKSLFE